MSTNLSNDIDEKINLIYNFNYELSDKSCYQISPIDIKNIKMDDIKILYDNEYNQDFVNQIVKGNFQLLSFSDKTNLSIFKRYSDNFSIGIFISTYDNIKATKNMENKNNKDSLFSYVLSSIVLDDKTPHILLPILNIDIKFEDIESIIKSYPLFDNYKILVEEDKISNIFSLKIKENYFSSNSLNNYLNINKGKINYKILLFQVIFTLAMIQKEYPDFRHNDLSLDSILIQENNLLSNNKYKIDNLIFEIKDNKIKSKIFSFFHAESNIILKGSSKNSGNKYSDLHYFLKKLYKFNKFMDCDTETQTFLNKVIPKNYIDKSNVDELFTPKKLLEDNYFKSFQININEKKSSKKEYMTNNFQDKNNKMFMTNLESESKSVLGNQSELYSETKIKRVEVNKKGSKKMSRKVKQKGGSDIRVVRKNVDDLEILTRKLKINQEGGSFRRTSAPYKREANNPYLTNDARDTYSKTKEEKPFESREPPVLAEQKIYDLNKGSKPTNQYMPTEIAAYNPFYAQAHPMYPWESRTAKYNVVKPVNISFSNPVNGSHMTINKVYEDMLPGDRHAFSLRSVFERNQLTNFLRSMILENGDGEELSISAGNKRSLLSYIRLLEVNPYSIERNPYRSLSKGFLLYSSAYPIRYDREKDYLSVAKQATSVNVRLYELSEGANRCFKLNRNISCDDFEVWRDIKYYEFMRENVIKKKVSPNFVSLYLYTIDSTSRIDYGKVDIIRNQSYPSDMNKFEIENNKKVNNLHELDPLQFLMLDSYRIYHKTASEVNMPNLQPASEDKAKEVSRYLARHNYMIGSGQNWKWTETGIQFLGSKGYFRFVTDVNNQPVNGGNVRPEEIRALANIIGKQDLTNSTGSSLVALTEAPNTNIIQWASPLADNFGTVQKMVETGYHTPDVWKSVLFQLVYACAVLQEKEVYFHKFSLENNFYIKDLFVNSEKRDHWVYKVGELSFYIPNYGYLLMVDSKYVDIGEMTTETFGSRSEVVQYKINSNIYSKNNLSNIKDMVYTSFKNIINPDSFRRELGKKSGEQPDQEILDLLTRIYNDNSVRNIRDYLVKYFPFFLNNRIGTLISNEERSILPLIPSYNFKPGEMVVYQERYGEFKWAVFIGNDTNGKKLIRHNVEGDAISVYPNTLFNFPENSSVKQNYKNFINYDSSFTLDTYNLDN